MEQHVRIDLTKIVGLVVSVISQPYNDLLAKLSAEGRVTEEEVQQLREEIQKRGASLPELVAGQLGQGDGKESPLPHPGLA
jgi:hypothetical protein